MKYLVTLILGLFAGAVLGIGALYVNPLTTNEAAAPGAADWTLTYESPVSGGIALTHGGDSRLPSHPAGVPELWENTINKMLLSVFRVSSPDGRTGIASRLSLPSESSELLRRGVIVTDHWLITMPGEGSLFVDADSNLWPFIKRDLLPVWYLGRAWRGPQSYSPTTGPGLGQAGIVQGATGRFANLDGSSVERYHVSVFNRQRGPDEFEAELFINLPELVTASAPEQAAD